MYATNTSKPKNTYILHTLLEPVLMDLPENQSDRRQTDGIF